MFQTVKADNTAGIYLHIPFCKQACIYCNFHFSTSLKYKDDVLAAMMREIALQQHYLGNRQIETVYFGGGTPSLLSADDINRLFDTIAKFWPLNNLKEVTLEANPDDLNKQYLRQLRQTPISRFSIGIQSFHDKDLLYMKRAHNGQQAEAAVKGAQDAGFDNLTIDLIYGIPGLSDTAWQQNLNKVKELSLPHFSAYALTVEERTALYHAIAKKAAAPVDTEQSAAQFEILMAHAPTIGFEHYEISNLAQPGRYAVHNTNYWRGNAYLGIGPSAHSFDGDRRRHWNVANNITYTQGLLQHNRTTHEDEVLTDADRMNEYIMTSLRTQWGCDTEHIGTQWGSDTVKELLRASESFQERQWVQVQDGILKLTNRGRLFADRIASELFTENE